jgi:hypothetical protein
MIQEGDIIFTHSGGNDNTDPTKDLGGDPSSHGISTGINNLFADVTEEQSVSGYTDYRCFYIFNNSSADNLFNTRIWLEPKTPNGTTQVQLGVNVSNDIQQIAISGNVTSGYLNLNFDGVSAIWSWQPTLAAWALGLQNVMMSNFGLAGVIVTVSQVQGASPVTNFTLNFTGDDAARFQPLLSVTQNNLVGATNIAITKVQDGGPINSIAPSIDQPTTTPFGVLFSNPSHAQPLVLGTMRPTDGIPVWIKRVVPANTKSSTDDGAVIHFTGNPF